MKFLVKKSILAFVVGLLIIVVGGILASNLKMESNMEDMLSEESEVLKRVNDFDTYFPSNESGIIVVQGEAEKSKNYIMELTPVLEKADYVESVVSTMDATGTIFFESEDSKTFLVFIKPTFNEDFAKDRELFYDGVKKDIDGIEHSGLEVGLTGGAFIQDIEADEVAFDGLFGTFVITLVLILMFILFSFRKITLPLSAGIPLVGGAVVSAGAAYILYGSLNMFSVSFAILLLGLGVDYGVHLISRYQEERQHLSIDESLEVSLKSSGTSIIIGSVTTGFAFFAFAIGDFKAFEQMGVISGIGIVLLCIMMFLMMPFLIRTLGKKTTNSIKYDGRKTLGALANISIRKPIIAGVILLVVVVGLIPSVMNTTIVGDVSKIYPKGLASVELAKEVEEAFGLNTNSVSLYVDSYEELKVIVPQLEAMDSVTDTMSMVDFADLPEEMISDNVKTNYIGLEDKYLIEVTPALNIFEQDHFKAFEDDIYDITGKRPIGMPVLMNEVVHLVTNDVIKISILCLLIILVILLLIQRSVVKSLITMVPIILTLFITIGIMNLFKIDLNIFAIAAFPLIIGIGIDSGIHLMHRLTELGKGFEPIQISSTIRAIFITTVTTIIGFSSLTRINHPGMQSLGMAVSIGIAICFILTVLIIPASYLILISKKSKIIDMPVSAKQAS